MSIIIKPTSRKREKSNSKNSILVTDLQKRLIEIRNELPSGVRLVAVSKFQPLSALQEAYEAGQRVFGESRVQELKGKQELMPKDVEWHFIGHLQANKVKYIAPYISLVHAVDSLKLLAEINRQAEKCGRVISCLLQVHVAREETKFGFSPEELETFLSEGQWKSMAHVRICGLMCMATFTSDEEQIRQEFRVARNLFEKIRNRYFSESGGFTECSWGMSDDYPIAIEEGSNWVRVGTKIFGARQ